MSFVSSGIRNHLSDYSNEHVIKTPCQKFSIYTRTKEIPNTVRLQIPIMLKQIEIATEFAPNKDLIKQVNIKYYPTRLRKKMPLKGKPFKIENVNSGYTTQYYVTKYVEIVIFRYEEAEKVLLHELIHALKYHCVLGKTVVSSFDKQLRNEKIGFINIRLESGQEWDEAIVEAWATILTFTMNEFIKQNADLSQQATFSAFQTAKILRHLSFRSWEDFVNVFKEKKIVFFRQPSIFPYYILKSAFIWQLDEFTKTFPLDEIKKCNSKNLNDFEKFLTFPRWISAINFFMKMELETLESYKTMRMTFPYLNEKL